MLPIQKKLKEGSVSAPVETVKRDPDEEPEYDSMESAAEDLMHAVHSKDVKGIAMALRSAIELFDSQPHEEGPHE